MMTYNPAIHHRRSIRLKGYDYSQAGSYFITICVKNREHLFGEIINDEMVLNEYGMIVKNEWFDLPDHYNNIELGQCAIMPNHFHGIIIILSPVGAGYVGAGLKPAPTGGPAGGHGLPEIVRALKTFSSRKINILRNAPGIPVWQRNYYEHIIRDEESYRNISEYIKNNPLSWHEDDYYE